MTTVFFDGKLHKNQDRPAQCFQFLSDVQSVWGPEGTERKANTEFEKQFGLVLKP